MSTFPFDLKSLPRCSARSKQRNNQPCKQAACRNGVCYYHGGVTSTLKHGKETKMAHAQSKKHRHMIDQARDVIVSLESLINDSEKGNTNEQQ